MRRLVCGCVVLCTGLLWSVERVVPVNASEDAVLAEVVLKPSATAGADDSDRLQTALNDVREKGGGTVFLALGDYTVTKPITVPVGVTLRGDPARRSERVRQSTVLRIRGGHGDENGPAAFTVNPGAGLVGLVFFYPDQTLTNPTPYPWTVRSAAHPPVANDNQTVLDCTFVNSWQGIQIGPDWNELHTIRNVRLCALKTGLSIDSTTDIGRITDVFISPTVWTLFSLGDTGGPQLPELREWLLTHETTGVDFGRSDWEFVRGLTVVFYRTGVRFRKGRQGLTNGVIAKSSFLSCGVGLDLVALNGVGLAVYDSTFSSERSVLFEPGFDSIAQFYGCKFAKDPVPPSKHALVRDVLIPRRDWKRPAFPRPASKALYDVATFGASPDLDDNAPAFQKALDAAKKGGTVYVPAGRYRFRGNLVVPAGVELRGCSAVPHHTCSGGSVLMPLHGRNEEKGTPFISLGAQAGLRGLCFWYPEQTTIAPVPYPWTVRSLGPGCWIRDVNIGNGWQGVDFASHPSDNHLVSYLSGCCWRRALFVGKSRNGYVEDLQFNPHYSLRRPHGLPAAKNPPAPPGPVPAAGWESGWLREHLQGFVFQNCASERIVGTFLYAAREGLVFTGANSACVLIHGTDTGTRGVVLDQRPGSRVEFALAQLVPWDSSATCEKAAIWCAPSDKGEAFFRASQFWAGPCTYVQRGMGTVVLDSLNSLSGPMAVYEGVTRLVATRYANPKNNFVDIHGGVVKSDGCDIRKVEKKEDVKK